jgi:hypothetical protein
VRGITVYLVVVGDRTLSVGPVRVEKPVVGASSRGGGTGDEVQGSGLCDVDGRGEHRGNAAEGEQDGGEGDHCSDCRSRYLGFG